MIANIILIITLCALILYCGFWFFGVYYNSKRYCDRCISFEKFLTIYENAPEKMDLYEGYFSYTYYDNAFDIISNRISFHFTIPDTIRYERWRKEMKREEEKEKADAVMEKVEKFWAEDAANARWKSHVDKTEQEQANVNQTR